MSHPLRKLLGKLLQKGEKMKRYRLSLPLLSTLALTLSFQVPASHASVVANGEFAATRACPAYQSKNSKTNPGDVQTEPGKTYNIVELNKLDAPSWYRLRVEGENPDKRWVAADCGTAQVTSHGRPPVDPDTGDSVTDCNTAGQEDSYVFAISWQPAFCEGHRNKPECKVDDPTSFQANNFTLHGLWPNKKSCGTRYGFCGKYSSKKPFCELAPVPMQPATLEALGQVMPSASHGSCLQRHEWYKHGTCQLQWNADQYFKESMRLLNDFNSSGMAKFMQDNMGKPVKTKDFFAAVDQAFQKDAHKRMQISCYEGKLVDIYINLPVQIEKEDSLVSLLSKAAPRFNNKCGESFEVDPIGQ
jgi:ribonuclease T2